MRYPRIVMASLLPFAVLACSEEAPEVEPEEEKVETKGEFGEDTAPPPASSWGDDGFVDGGESGDSSLNEPAESAEDLR